MDHVPFVQKERRKRGANDLIATQLRGRKRLVKKADLESVPNNAPMAAEEKT
jgi:hypothetical protein